jgi:hypothetical protein
MSTGKLEIRARLKGRPKFIETREPTTSPRPSGTPTNRTWISEPLMSMRWEWHGAVANSFPLRKPDLLMDARRLWDGIFILIFKPVFWQEQPGSFLRVGKGGANCFVQDDSRGDAPWRREEKYCTRTKFISRQNCFARVQFRDEFSAPWRFLYTG